MLRSLTTRLFDGVHLVPTGYEAVESSNSENVASPVIEMSGDGVPAGKPEGILEDVLATTTGEVLSDINREDSMLILEAAKAAEPADVYDAFTEGLSDYMLRFNGSVDTSEAVSNSETSAVEENASAESCPLVLVEVIEGLKELEGSEKDEVAVILKEIVGAIHDLYVLEAADGDGEFKAQNEERLEALYITLFDKLGIDYDDYMLSQFAGVLRSKEFRPRLLHRTGEIDVDLEKMGTHEAKFFKKLVSRSLLPVSRRLARRLGTFALSYARTSVTA